MTDYCIGCRIAGRAGFMMRRVGAQLLPEAEAPKFFDWPRECNVCGYTDDGDRPQLSPWHRPYLPPALQTKEPE